MSKPRIIFFGYSEVGYTCIDLLVSRGDNVIALFTHEDNPNEKIWFKTPASLARENNIPIYTSVSVNTPEWIEKIAALKPDLILSVYYRNMISEAVLALAPLGAFNMHGSLLPKFRGRAPINWAIVKGAKESGMTLHRMVKKADAGNVVDQAGTSIGPRDSAEHVFRKVLPLAREVLSRQIDALLTGTAREKPQDESQATYFTGRTPEDGRIRWNLTSQEIYDLVRAVTDPYPGAFTEVGSSKLMIWWCEVIPTSTSPAISPGQILSLAPLTIATGDGAVELTRVEWRGSQPTLKTGQIL